MRQQHPKRGRRRPWVLVAATGAVGVLVACVLSAVGYVEYRQWAPKAVQDAGTAPSQQPPQAAAWIPPPLPPAPPASSPEEVSQWRQAVAQQSLPPQAPRQFSTDELIAAVDKAFAEPAADLKPAVVFLPFVDGAGQVRPDGYPLGLMAAYAATYTPHRRLVLSTNLLREELSDAGCLTPGVRIEPEMIALCTAALETKLYALPRLEGGDGKQVLTVEFHGDGKAYPDRTFRHEIPADGLRTAPGLVARDALEALGVTLDEAELKTLLEPGVRNDQELASLNEVLSRYPAGASEQSWLFNFLQANPRCALGWDLYLMNGHLPPDFLLKVLSNTKVEPFCDRLQVNTARLQRDSGRAEDALLALLKLAPTQRRDADYHATLIGCAIALGDERLANHLFEVWAKADPGYAGCLERGKEWTEWGWAARGTGWASTVTPEGWKLFHERLGRARSELEQAVQRDPSGCRAHVALMVVARGLGLPAEFEEEQFRQALRARPRYYPAYLERFEYLRPRWHGDAEQLLAFGKECLETGDWDDDIPPLCGAAIWEAASPMSDDVLRTALTDGPLWDLLRAYEEAAEKNATPKTLARARNIFARLGVVGGRFDEVVPAFQKLEEAGVSDPEIFAEQGEYDYFRDLVHARTGKLPTGPVGRKHDRALAQAGVALAAGDLDEAEKDLARVEQGDAADDRLAERYRGTLAVGRKLRADGSVALSPQQVKDICVTEKEQNWTVEGNGLTGRHLLGPVDLVLPLGLQDAVITGTTAWDGKVSTVEMRVDARSTRHKGHMLFFPDLGQARLMRNHTEVAKALYQPGPQPFRLELGSDEDRLEPSPGIRWRVPSDSDLPGCFAMGLWTGTGDATWSISDLRIELKK